MDGTGLRAQFNAIAISTTVSHRAQEREGGTQWRLASVPVRPTEGGFVNSLPWSRVRLVSRDGSRQPVVIGGTSGGVGDGRQRGLLLRLVLVARRLTSC